jgi:diguanylate cyclase (GGDEF)-like protein
VQVLHEIARTLTSSLDLDHVLQAIMQQMARAFHPESWALLMMDPVLQELRFTAGSESVLGGKQELRVPVGEGILGWVAQHGEPLVITNARDDPRTRTISIAGERPLETLVCMPLRARSQVHGVIQLANCDLDDMQEQEMFFLHALCDYAAIAIQNSRYAEEIRKLTITDDCTGLYNSRHLYQTLGETLEHWGRKKQPVSLVFFDLDRFKQVNDTYGHLVGSKLLAEVGNVVRNNIGPLGAAYRYGGDEFIVLLPGMGKAQSVRTAQHLLEMLHQTPFLAELGQGLHLKASFGVATAPEDAQDLHGIIRAADAAMYRIKNSTRDSVGAAGDVVVEKNRPSPSVPIRMTP